MSKWFYISIVIGIGICTIAFWHDLSVEKEFETKCNEAGGIPSKYHMMIGKIHRYERACLHPSAVINLE